MKYHKYILATVFSLMAPLVFACGPALYSIPRPEFLRLCGSESDIDIRTENLRLWQSQTSENVRPEDIDAVIYGDLSPQTWGPWGMDYEDECVMVWGFDDFSDNPAHGNTFINYLINTSDSEALNFIMMAKYIAGLRSDRNSPWYYPASRNAVTKGFDPVIRTIRAYSGERFYNRYSLQLIRALFASARYEECIAVFGERFAGVADDDLMKRLSRDYVAGAATRLGDSQAAAEYFASTGDVSSLARYTSCENPFKVAALANPESPKLLRFIEQKFNGNGVLGPDASDSAFVKETIVPVARRIVQKDNVGNRAMWYYVLAVGEGEFNKDFRAAYRCIRQAAGFPSGRFADYIRGYRIAVEAQLGIQANLLSNLRWLESRIGDVTSTETSYWERVMQNVVFSRVAPWFSAHGDNVTAMQLANYAENMSMKYSVPNRYCSPLFACWQQEGCLFAREDARYWNYHDYSNKFFEFMTMQTPQTIESYIASLASTAPLAAFLNSSGYTDRDYLYDVAGTMYLAHRDYANAVRVLSRVSDSYQSLLNVDRSGYLRRNPFVFMSDLQRNEWTGSVQYCNPASGDTDPETGNTKLRFAREMLRLERVIRNARSGNERGMARLRYSIGLENSFNNCWALTSYYRGLIFALPTTGTAEWVYWPAEEWPYKSESAEVQRINRANADAAAMRRQALAEITDPETAARAHQMIYNFRTIARYYPDTAVGRMMAAECDSWADWVAAP